MNRCYPAYTMLGIVYLLLLAFGSELAAFSFKMMSRLAYLVYLAPALRKQADRGYFTKRYGLEEGFGRFRTWAVFILNNDTVSFVLLCMLTRDTLPAEIPHWVTLIAGIPLVMIGVAVKVWAAMALGAKRYYWYDFFDPKGVNYTNSGPYRYLKNPLYTIGYAYMYGFSLVFSSSLGLLAAIFDHIVIWILYLWVERPHSHRMRQEGADGEGVPNQASHQVYREA
ncbi:MAG: PEMT/PEM2 family methyltransferase [Candidatus Binatia bacterium]